MKKKLVSAMMSAVMLAGCFVVSPVSAEGDGEVVKLRMMGYNAESTRATYLKYLDELLPNIEIEFEFVSTDNFDNVLNSQLQAGEGPDIIEVGGQTKLLAKAGYLLDLSDQEFIKKYTDSGLQAYTVDGGIYAEPLQSWFEGIFYNKKMESLFRRHGMSSLKSIKPWKRKESKPRQWGHSLTSQ